MSLTRRLAPPTARRLLRGAGPPIPWDLAGLAAGGILLAVGAVVLPPARWLVNVVAIVAFAAPGLLDRTGWRVRVAMAQLTTEQRRRMPGARLPRTPAGADRWLARPESEPDPLTQASVLLMAGRTNEARAAIDGFVPTTDDDAARVSRMLAAVDGLDTGVVDTSTADAAIARLPPEARRYHRLALAWSVAWVDASNRRPWRERFAAAADGLDWSGVPLRFRAWHVAQQLAALLAGLALIVVLVLLGTLR